MKDNRTASEKLAEKLEEKDRRIRELEAALAERDRRESAHRVEASRLARAFQRAGLRTWFWAHDTRLTHYLPVDGCSPGSRGERAGQTSVSEDRLLRDIHSEDRERVALAWSRAHGIRAAYDIEYRLVGRDGTVRHQRETATPEHDDAGRYLGQVGITEDITDLRRAEEEVRTRDAWLRAILENTPIEIVLKDTEGRIIAVSRVTAESFGVAVSDCIGRTTADFLPPRLAEAYMAADRKVVETGLPSQQEIAEEVDGKTRHSLNAKFPLRDDGGRIVGVCSITNDITDMKDMQARLFEAQKMEAVGRLTGGVAHDFNNLLAAIIGNAELLEEEPDRDEGSLQAILKAATRGAELTHRLLAFSRRQFLRPKPIDIAALVGGLSDLLVRTLGETIEITTVGGPGLWAASADPGQVENAILNLAINARDAMPRGGKLTIECLNTQLDETYVSQNPEAIAGDYVMLAVSDTGTGMSEEVRAHAFEPFFTTKEVGEGSGLGLSMVYGFAKQSGGHVEILSEDGAGTTVRLYLPRAAEAPMTEAEGAEEAPVGCGETVLVIEDEPEVRTLAAKMLRSLEYNVIDVAEAADARMVLANGERVDVMLTDVVLSGGVSGPEFAAEARARNPGLKAIFMSGYPAETATRHGCLDSGEVLLNKPFLRSRLAKVLRETLD